MKRPPFPKKKTLIAAGHDLFMIALSFAAALSLRLGIDDTKELLFSGTLTIPWVIFIVTGAAIFWLSGLYRGIWRYASLNDLAVIVKASVVLVVLYIPLLFLWNRVEEFPRSILIINLMTLVFLLGVPRLLFRLYKEGSLKADFLFPRQKSDAIPILLMGVNDQAEAFIRQSRKNKKSPYRVLALLDLSLEQVGRRIHGHAVLGCDLNKTTMESIMERFPQPPQKLVLASLLDRKSMQSLQRVTEELGLTLERLPRFIQLDSTKNQQIRTRPIAVEDLLGRQEIYLDKDSIREMIGDQSVLITGAGGSIGSELVRQIARMGPRRLILLDNGEYNLYRIDMTLLEQRPELDRVTLLADVRNLNRLESIFQRFKPQILFHAAALKHVPMVEDNPCEGLMTNVFGTKNVADCCQKYKVKTMVLISTDKAINPPNIMGASKRLAEIYCQSLDLANYKNSSTNLTEHTRFVTVRFGNVLGSTGSVVPLFKRQLEAGGPLTVTHPEITRYFMSIREAVELVLQSAVLARANEEGSSGKIYVLEMGEPVKVVDLARQVIRLAGYEPDKDIKIKFTGLRPGEKLHEELFHSNESLQQTSHPGLQIASPCVANRDLLLQSLSEMATAIAANDQQGTLKLLYGLVPEYCGKKNHAARKNFRRPENTSNNEPCPIMIETQSNQLDRPKNRF